MVDISLIIVVIGIALIFDFLNGFHDAANAIATIVVTKVLTPLQAVILAGFANFIGYFTFGTAIAKTIGQGVIEIDSITITVILSALIGAVLWNLITWLLGLPTSSSHALIGGLIGSGIAAAGFKVLVVGGVVKILLFIIVAPLLGMIGAVFFTILVMRLFRKSNPMKVTNIFKKLQLVSALFYSIGHGTNDAQKTMGIIVMTLMAGGFKKSFELDGWIVLACYSAIAVGTMLGGWRIIKTMGTQIIKIKALEGFCSSSASSLVLIGTALTGIPVSTTHVTAGSIMGVGVVEFAGKVRWVTARKIIWAWIITIPLTALCAAFSYIILSYFIGK